MNMLNTSRENQSILAKRRNKLLANMTTAEKRILELLTQMNERFISQKGFFSIRTHYIVDFYLPKRKKLCLEVDGPYHLDQAQIEYDKRRDKFLTDSRGFRVIRITNDQALIISREELLKLIQ